MIRDRRSISKQLEELAGELAELRAASHARAGIPVIVVAPCGCEGCAGAFRNSSCAGPHLGDSGSSRNGDALVITLGCSKEIPPPMPVPADDEPEAAFASPPAVAGPTVAELATGNPALLARLLNRDG